MLAVPNETYIYSGWAKIDSGEFAIVGIDFLDTSQNILARTSITVTDTVYQPFTLSDTAPANTTAIQAWGWKDDGSGYLYMDELSLSIGGSITPPQVSFTASPISGTVPLTVTFANSSTGADSFSWQFGDGTTSTELLPTHVYTQTGSYTVTLTATGQGGIDTLSRADYITVNEASAPVQAAFSAFLVNGTVPLTVTFTNNSTGADSYLWGFGDGVTSTVTAPTYVYSQAGVYTVTLDATGLGGTDTLSRSNYITVTNPVIPITRTWQMISTTTSVDIWGEYAMAYDSSRDTTVLYGGNGNGWPYKNSIWEFDGTNWSEKSTANRPNAVYGMAMAYADHISKTILFGGSNSSDVVLAETWQYDGNDWTQLTPLTSPPALANYTLVYDPNSNTTYLFGGNDSTTYFSDVWEFNGTTWNQIDILPAPPPSARAYHSMAVNSDDNKLYLFGGRDATGTELADLWTFDPSNDLWVDLSVTGPDARYAQGMVYDPTQKMLVLVSGASNSGDTIYNDTWHYDGSVWTISSTPPAAPDAAYHTLIYDDNLDTIITFTNGETWQYK